MMGCPVDTRREISNGGIGMRAWLMLAAGDDREHGGNEGYDDDAATHYAAMKWLRQHWALHRV